MKKIVIYILLIFSLTNCKKNKGREIEKVAEYTVTFNLNWNNIDFPIDYPTNAHFSKVIGWSHNTNSTFFTNGTTSSEGVKEMAERGKTAPLNNEIASKINDNQGHKLFIGNSLSAGVGTIVLENIEITKEFPLVSFVSMLAPSPDWYIGVLDVLLNKDEEFFEEKTVNITVYDAGTDSGITFSANDSITSPQENIRLFVDTPLGNGVVINKIIGTATFIKLIKK